MEMVGAEEVAMVSRPSSTGSLRRLRVRSRPEEGSTPTSVSLKVFVPISTAANRLLLAVPVAGGGPADIVSEVNCSG